MGTGILAGLWAWVWDGDYLEEQSKIVVEFL